MLSESFAPLREIRSIAGKYMIRFNVHATNILSTVAILAAAFLFLADRQLVIAADPGDSQKSLEDVLKPAIEAHHGDVGLAVKHLTTGETYEYKADRPMPTASLIKLPVMIATYEAVDKEKLSLSELIDLKKG